MKHKYSDFISSYVTPRYTIYIVLFIDCTTHCNTFATSFLWSSTIKPSFFYIVILKLFQRMPHYCWAHNSVSCLCCRRRRRHIVAIWIQKLVRHLFFLQGFEKHDKCVIVLFVTKLFCSFKFRHWPQNAYNAIIIIKTIYSLYVEYILNVIN